MLSSDHDPVVLDARVVTGTGGGPEKTILNSPRYLREAGYRMVCAYMHPPGDPGFEQLRQKAVELEAPLLPVRDRGPLDPAVLTRLLEICRQERVVIWHAHDYKSNLIGLLLRPFWPMRLVATVHGWVTRTFRTPLYYGIDRLSLPRYERVLCVSPDLHRKCLAYGVAPKRCLLVENAIDTSKYARQCGVAEAKRRLGLDPNRPLIGTVGRLSVEKGHDVLVRAVDRLVREGTEVVLAIVGEGSQRAALEAQVSALGYQDRVFLPGYCADPKIWYEAMDVFALSSLREGLPNALLEALALGVPAVATRIAGVPKLISHEETGLLVEPGSDEQLAKSLDALLKDSDLRERLSRQARRMIETEYDFGVRMQKIRAIYDDLLGSAHPRSGHTTSRPATAEGMSPFHDEERSLVLDTVTEPTRAAS